MASAIHKKRIGRGFKISEEIVTKEDMYEEEDDDLPRLRANKTSGSYGSFDLSNIPPGMSVADYQTRIMREAEVNDLFAKHFPSVSGPSQPSPQQQQQMQQQQLQQQQAHVQNNAAFATQFQQQQQQQQQMHQMQQQQQQYHNQQQRQQGFPMQPQQQQADQFFHAQPQAFPAQQPLQMTVSPQQQQVNMSPNDAAYYQHRTSVTSVAVSNDGSGSFTMVSPHTVHAGIVGHVSRSNSVAAGSDMMPGLSNASSSNDTGSNPGSHRLAMPVDMTTVPGSFGVAATAHDAYQSVPLLGPLATQTFSPPGLNYSSTPTTTPSVSTPASQGEAPFYNRFYTRLPISNSHLPIEGSIAAVAVHSPMPQIRRESSGVVPTSSYRMDLPVAPAAEPTKPIDTAAWAADAGTAAMTFPVMDPNVSQYTQVNAGTNLAVSAPMSAWTTMYPQDGTIATTADPVASVPFSQTMDMDGMDDIMKVEPHSGYLAPQQSDPISTSPFPAVPSPLHSMPPHMTVEAMKEQISSRIGTPGGGAGDPWNEWVQFGHNE